MRYRIAVCLASLFLSNSAFALGKSCPGIQGKYRCLGGAVGLNFNWIIRGLDPAFQIEMMEYKWVAGQWRSRPVTSELHYSQLEPYWVHIPGQAERVQVRSFCEKEVLIVISVPEFSENREAKEHHLFLEKSGELIIQEGSRREGLWQEGINHDPPFGFEPKFYPLFEERCVPE